MPIEESSIRHLVGAHSAWFREPPTDTASPTVTDAPLLGNGDLGAAIAGGPARQLFLLGKNDFWKQVHVSETDEQRRARLLHDTGRRTGTRRVALGWMEIHIPQLEGARYLQEQDFLHAEVRGTFIKGETRVEYQSIICAEKNLLVVAIHNNGSTVAEVQFSIMPGQHGHSEVFGYRDGVTEDVVWFDYPADPQTAAGRREVAVAVTTDATDVTYFPDRLMRKGGQFSLAPGTSARVYLTALSDLDAPNHRDQAIRHAKSAVEGYQHDLDRHRAWWLDYWGRSLVDTGDEILNKFYYASLYLLASSTRGGKTPPGLWGPWVFSDTPAWTGSYTMNYNYQAPFFCLYTSNRAYIAESYFEPLLDIIPLGQFFARQLLDRRGVYLPVELGPWGTVCNRLFFHQKSNALFSCVNILMHFYTTYDLEWTAKAYPFLKEVADFWVDDLVYERGQFNVVKDAVHEEYAHEGDTNNPMTLGLLRMFFRGILDISRSLSIQTEESSAWKKILENLAPYPVYARNGEAVFRYSEVGREWGSANDVGLRHIYPAGQVGLSSDPETLRVARNSFDAHPTWDSQNSFCEHYAIGARIGHDPQVLLARMKEQCLTHGLSNLLVYHGGGGIEGASGVPGAINEMMLQTHEEVFRIFPVWPRGRDASFWNLRGYGAFLVSADIRNDRVAYVEMTSEKGNPCTVQNPWGNAAVSITRNKGAAMVVTGNTLSLATQPGEVIRLTPAS